MYKYVLKFKIPLVQFSFKIGLNFSDNPVIMQVSENQCDTLSIFFLFKQYFFKLNLGQDQQLIELKMLHAISVIWITIFIKLKVYLTGDW